MDNGDQDSIDSLMPSVVNPELAPIQSHGAQSANVSSQKSRTQKSIEEEDHQLFKVYGEVRGEKDKDEAEYLRRELSKARKSLKALQMEMSRTQRESGLLEADNNNLRAKIARMCSPREPLRDEADYQTDFRVLNWRLEGWIATQTKNSSLESFTPERQAEFLTILDSIQYSKCPSTLDYLRKNFHELYQKRPSRIALLRFVIGLFLFEKVLGPFAFGLTLEDSAVHILLEDGILHQG